MEKMWDLIQEGAGKKIAGTVAGAAIPAGAVVGYAASKGLQDTKDYDKEVTSKIPYKIKRFFKTSDTMEHENKIRALKSNAELARDIGYGGAAAGAVTLGALVASNLLKKKKEEEKK